MNMTNYFLKCDISGIQPFIFNVPSEGAAKALKSRSIFVKNIADGCLEELKDFFEDGTVKELYNGGGNFYLEITADKSAGELVEEIKRISDIYLESDIFPYIAFTEKKGSIGDLLNEVNRKVQKAKMNRPLSFNLFDAKPVDVPEVDINTVPGINGQVPDGDFEWIAEKSDGDHKLAAVKLDVDNLGSLFKDRTKEDYTTLSKALTDFFDARLLQLISDLEMRQNIYAVFSGGDDCFLIGTWEKAFQLAIQLRQDFADFQRDLKYKIMSLPKDDITFSAGIVVFTPHHPMLRLAEEAEEALSASKSAGTKNSITVFGKTLTWTEFEQSQKLAATLADLINNKGESKSLLMIFRLIEPQKKEMPKVWWLKYFLRRNVRNEKVTGPIFDGYSQALLCRYVGNKSKNPDVWLVASRWAELLMKKRI
jgi:CRISPR-associated protein Csm1